MTSSIPTHIHRPKAPWLLFLAAALVAVLGLGAAGRASAAITTTQITTPAGTTFQIENRDLPETKITIAGTTDSTDPAHDRVDLYCLGEHGYNALASEVPLAANGSFSAAVPTGALYSLCRLRAFPAGGVPADEAPFSGPVSALGSSYSEKLQAGPNAGTTVDFGVFDQQLGGGGGFGSAGNCGLYAGYLADDTPEETAQTFGCSDYFWWTADLEGEDDTSSRSELQVDGHDAYLPATARQINADATGFPAVSFSYHQDPANGNLVLTESDPVVECEEQAFPPTGCPSFIPAGVVLDRTIEQTEGGRLVTITDRFSSSDGEAHGLDLLNQQSGSFTWTFPRDHPLAFQFPSQGGYSVHSSGDVVPFAADSPGTIYIRQQATPDGDHGTGRGAIVFDRPASPATFNYDAPTGAGFYLHQTATVPAEGPATFRFAYAHAYSQAEVEALAGKAQAAFAPAAPAGSGQPQSQTPAPPSASKPQPQPKPAGDVRVAKVDLDRRHGTAKVSLLVPGPGQVTLGGRQLQTVKREVGAAGPVVLTVRPNPALAATLRQRGSARVLLEISFTPVGGTPRKQARRLALVRVASR